MPSRCMGYSPRDRGEGGRICDRGPGVSITGTGGLTVSWTSGSTRRAWRSISSRYWNKRSSPARSSPASGSSRRPCARPTGFAVREPRKGISVAKVTPREAESIYRIRASLEGLAISLAVQNRTPEFLQTLKALHQQMVRAAKQKKATAYHKLNRKFHELLIGA